MNYPNKGAVIFGTIKPNGPFVEAKARPMVVTNQFGFAVPLTSTGNSDTWIDPSRQNGLETTSGLITEHRAILAPDSHYSVVGQMSDAEMAVIRAATSFGYEMVHDIT